MAPLSMLSSRPQSRTSMRSDQARSNNGHASFKYYLPSIASQSAAEPPIPHHAAQQAVATMSPGSRSLVHGYMVCGLARLPEDWIISTQTVASKAYRIQGSIGPCVLPTILGSIPTQDKDAATAQMFSSALKAVFPNDAEVCSTPRPPVSTCHGFVLQMHSSQSLYGVALKLWVRSDVERTGKILQVLAPNDPARNAESTSLWMPYCLAYLSHYPLFDLMSDYLRCTWMLYGKDPDKFNSNGVLRMTRLPSPQSDQILRIELDHYTFSYLMPAHPEDFQNFALWPFFTCLTPAQVIAILEAAHSPKGRIVFTSQYPAMMTIAAETVRFYVKSWAGLYQPIVYGSHAQELLNEDAPYMLGLTRQSRAQVVAPRDALVVDLDQHRIYTSQPPGSLSPRQRKKYAAMLSQVLFHADINGPPKHLKAAYEQNSRFSAAGSMLGTAENTPRAVAEPAWWDSARVLAAIQHICKRVRQNYKLLSALDSVRKQSVKVDISDLNKMIHDRNHFARNSIDAWDTYIRIKRRTDTKVSELLKHQSVLESNVASSKKEFADLSECTEQLIEDTRQLQKVVNQQKKDNGRLESELGDKTVHAKQLSSHVSELESELKDANHTLAMQQELIEEIERSREVARGYEGRFAAVSQERDEAHRAVIHLTSVIGGQMKYIERVLASLLAPERPSRPASRTESRLSRRRSFQTGSQAGHHPPPSSPGPGVLAHRNSIAGLPQWQHGRSSTMDFSSGGVVVGSNTPLSSVFASQTSPGRSASPLAQMDTPEDAEPSLRDKVGAVAATVRKINQQCLAAIQDLAERRTELDARSPTPTQEAQPEQKRNRDVSPTGSGSVSNDDEQNAESRPQSSQQQRHIEREYQTQQRDSDVASVADSARVSNLSAFSSVPDLDSMASTAPSRSESVFNDPRDEFSTPSPGNGPNVAIEPRIQSILEVDEEVDDVTGTGVGEAEAYADGKPGKAPIVTTDEFEQEDNRAVIAA